METSEWEFCRTCSFIPVELSLFNISVFQTHMIYKRIDFCESDTPSDEYEYDDFVNL